MQIEKPISSVSINYKDGTREYFDVYAVVGLSGETWYSALMSPAEEDDKVTLNNLMVDLSDAILDGLDRQRGQKK
ncbi:conserved hypothetical protein [Dehalogenimonas lykanthroporepellens BL-DC-9]|jgi:hypothetical protein|nr:conserved hypothetical protein [Dehalogenimonas lykanthroporepellens BL-DC-9]